jgi:hypothetical protein
MMTRLGFALVTALDPGVLLMDEGIGAGDARFAERAERRLNEFLGRSRIVVLASHAPGLAKSICNKAALLQAGRLVAIGPPEEVFEQYDVLMHGPRAPSPTAPPRSTIEPPASAAAEGEASPSIAGEPDHVKIENGGDSEWPLSEFKPDNVRNEYAECLGGTVETLGGILCGQPEIHVPFRLCLRYRLLKDSPHGIIPSIHLFDSDKRHVLVSTPSLLPPSNRGTYSAYCRIEPFTLNRGRYSVGLGLASVTLAEPIVHFYAESAMRFELTEPLGVDPRRHGYEGEFPGTSRVRLQWHIAKLDDRSGHQTSATTSRHS